MLLDQCAACGSTEMREEMGAHHFTQSGLDNVWLSNASFLICEKCNERTIRLPNPIALMKCIGEAVISTPGPLTGKEIKFLRKSLFLKSIEFANLIGVTRETVSRWESGNVVPDTSNDRLIRLTYANKANLSEKAIEELLQRFQKEDAAKKQTKSPLDYLVSFFNQEGLSACSWQH